MKQTITNSSTLNFYLRLGIMLFIPCVIFFFYFPDFDLSISRIFYDINQGGFYLKDNLLFQSIYKLTNGIAASILILLPVLIILSYVLNNNFLTQKRKTLVFLLSALILGPGIMVNAVLKDNWDRPRPRQVIEFGGSKIYEPPFAPNFACDNCHSFVSGHASVGFFFFAFALLHKNRKWFLLPILLGSTIGATRIVQGGHFFSDVIFSGFVVFFCSLFLFHLFFEFRPRKN